MLSPEEVLLDVTFLLIHNNEIRTYKLSLPSREIHVQFSSNVTTWPNVVYLILADSKNADLILKDAYENIDWYECPDGRSALSQATGRRRLEGVLLTHETGNLPHAPWIVQRPAWGTYRFLVSKKWNNNVPIQVTLAVTASGYDSWIEQISVATIILGGILLGFYSRILQHMFTRYIDHLYSKLRRRIYPGP